MLRQKSFFTQACPKPEILHGKVACSTAKKTKKASEHFREMFALAEAYDLFYVPAVEYYHLQDLFAPALSQFPAELMEKIQLLSKDLQRRYQLFAREATLSSLFSVLRHGDYPLVLYAAQGYSNKEIALLLGKTTTAVGAHFRTIYQHFHVTGKRELVEKYRSIVKNGLPVR